MHRSGTSAATGMLPCLGVTLGNKLYSGHENINAKGYFEHSNITDTNDEALLALNSTWDDILPKQPEWWKVKELEHYTKKIKSYLRNDFSQSVVWAVKDPRICRLIPWWLDILADEGIEGKFLFIVRPPNEVYRSLKRRDGFSLEKSYLLWILHYLDAEYWTRGLSRAFVVFNDLINDPVTSFAKIEKNLDLHFPNAPSQVVESLKQFASKDLIHHREQLSEDEQQLNLIKLATVLHNQLLAASLDSDYRLDVRQLDDIRSQINEYQQSFPSLLVEQLKDTYKIRSDLQLTMNKILRSSSWIMGKPVRFLERRLGKDV